METDIGILAWIGSDYLARADDLPPPGADQPPYVTRDVRHPAWGPVRVTYALLTYCHYKTRRWAWMPHRAEQLDPNARRPSK